MNNPNPKGRPTIDTENSPLPQGTDPILTVTFKDVILGRGSRIQKHRGNVIYRQLVFLNKELYAVSSKYDKIKIAKAIVRAVRESGGHFLEVKNEMYFDIGDKRAWYKTSQALREGQTEVRTRLKEEESRRIEVIQRKVGLASGQTASISSLMHGKRVISDASFLQYSRRVLETLYNPHSTVANTDKDEKNAMLPSAQTGYKPEESPRNKHRKVLTGHGTINQMELRHSRQPQDHKGHPFVPSTPPVLYSHAATSKSAVQNNALQYQHGNPNQQAIQALVAPNVDTLAASMPGSTNTTSTARFSTVEAKATDTAASTETASSSSASQQHVSSYHNSTTQKNESYMSVGAIASLRNTLCAADEITTEEDANQIERNLSDEIDELIKRHSAALAEIGCMQESEDLVLEEYKVDDKSVSSFSGKEPEDEDNDD